MSTITGTRTTVRDISLTQGVVSIALKMPAYDLVPRHVANVREPARIPITPMNRLHDAFIVGTILVPLLWLAVTLVVRHKTGSRQTSGADLLSFLVAFDFAAIVDPSYMAKLAKDAGVAAQLQPTLVLFVVIAIIAWIAAMLYVEPRLAANASAQPGLFATRPGPYLLGAGSWGVCWAIAFLHVLGYRGTI